MDVGHTAILGGGEGCLATVMVEEDDKGYDHGSAEDGFIGRNKQGNDAKCAGRQEGKAIGE